MKQAIFTKDGMKQIVDTGYKLFDKQTNCLSTANCIADTMIGFYIRPYAETKCNEQQFPEGVLTERDLMGYDLSNCPEAILEILRSPKRTEPVKFYQFFIYPDKRSNSKVFGYGLCSVDDTFWACSLSKNEIFNQYRYRLKKYKAIMMAMQYISNLNDPVTIAWVGNWMSLSEQGKEKYDQWVKPLVK